MIAFDSTVKYPGVKTLYKVIGIYEAEGQKIYWIKPLNSFNARTVRADEIELAPG